MARIIGAPERLLLSTTKHGLILWTQHRAADRANGYVVFQMAEGIIPKTLFAEILRRVDGLRQWEMGVLPDEEWDVWTRIICINRSSAGDRALWPGNKQTLIPSFIAWVEQNCKTAENLEGVVPQQVLPERN